jgi:hypothetical protein
VQLEQHGVRVHCDKSCARHDYSQGRKTEKKTYRGECETELAVIRKAEIMSAGGQGRVTESTEITAGVLHCGCRAKSI